MPNIGPADLSIIYDPHFKGIKASVASSTLLILNQKQYT